MENKKLDLYTSEEIAAQEKAQGLYSAIGILLKLEAELCRVEVEPIEGYKKVGRELKREYLPFEELFEKRYKKASTSCRRNTFARSEIEEITGLLEQVKQLSDASYYSKHETKMRAEDYIQYLNNYISNNHSGQLLPHITNPKGRPKICNAVRELHTYIKGDENRYNAVLNTLSERLAKGGVVELVKAVLVLQSKDYYIKADTRRELYDSLAKELGNIRSYNNFCKRLRAYDKALTESESNTINKLLP